MREYACLELHSDGHKQKDRDVQVGDTQWKRHEEQLRPPLMPQMQCSQFVREPQVPEPMGISTSVRDDTSITTSPPVVTKETETSKPLPVVNTPAINSEPNITPKPQHPFTEDSTPPTPLLEKPERRYPLRDRKPPHRFY